VKIVEQTDQPLTPALPWKPTASSMPPPMFADDQACLQTWTYAQTRRPTRREKCCPRMWTKKFTGPATASWIQPVKVTLVYAANSSPKSGWGRV